MANVNISKLPLTGVKFQPMAPDDTNIKGLALSPAGAALLTPKASTLTKADLIALHEDEAGAGKRLQLSVADIASIKQAFSNNLQISGLASSDLSVTVASCCTPCCCAAAVSVEVAIQ